MSLKPDHRWTYIGAGITEFGEVRMLRLEDLENLTSEWADIVAAIPPFGGTELLEQARSLFVQAWFDNELMVPACLRGLQAVEAAFRLIAYRHAGSHVPFRALVERACRDGLFQGKEAEALRAGVELRNSLSHPTGRSAFTLGIAEPIMRSCHLAIRDLCARTSVSDETL